MAEGRRRLFTVLAGCLLGSLALWLALRGLDLVQLLNALHGVDYAMTVAALLAALATLVINTVRWQLLFYPDHRRVSFAALFRANVVGQMLNIVSPVRVGEITRMYSVSGSEGIGKAQVLATLAIEKVLDLATFALAVMVVSATIVLPPEIRLQQRTLWIGGIAGGIALWWLARRPRTIDAALTALTGLLPERWQEPGRSGVRGFVDGLTALDSSGAGLAAVALSLALMIVAAWTNHLLFLAFGLHLPPVAALLLLVVLQVGAVPPSLPGKIGVFNYLTVVALSVFAVDRATAVGYSIVLYVVALLPKILIGGICLAIGAQRRVVPTAI